jgi:hypothetical protein
MHMAHIVREMRGVAPTANGFFFFFTRLVFSASAAHGLPHTPHQKWRFQRLKNRLLPPAARQCKEDKLLNYESIKAAEEAAAEAQAEMFADALVAGSLQPKPRPASGY